jgi:cation diffusion facilitator CzcD-associated flavoprotein CzcO
MTDKAAHVTMLQRSPSYIVSLPAKDPFANFLRRKLPIKAAYAITRWKNVLMTMASFQLSRRRPEAMKRILRKWVESELPEGFDIDTHFTPTYNPWDQRLCLVPDGDLFKAIRHGSASVVTDRIDTFTEKGIRLESGNELEADIIVTATGLNLLAFGGMDVAVDGEEINLPDTMGYKGMMLSGVPNFAFTIGYTNASWTLKADLVAEFVCRLLRHMDAHGYDAAVPINDDPAITAEPLLDFSAGYVLRSIDQFPKAGSRRPWRLGMSYAHDLVALRHGKVDDGAMRFARARRPATVGAAG